MKISLVITVLNEEASIDWLLESLAEQTLLPNEILIVDGGSTDATVRKIQAWKKHLKIGKNIRIFEKKGNRAVGRNFGIQKASHSWIAITDAGCVAFPQWLKNFVQKQQETQSEVIAGYAVGLPENRFQEAVVPYVLVMPDKVKPESFLPATRSMFLHKSVWKTLGGFDASLDHNEDFAFAKKIESAGIPIAFAPEALVGWFPRKNLVAFWKMISRFALGDMQARILRPKVALVFARYLAFFGLLTYFIITQQIEQTNGFFPVMVFAYLWWSIAKNKKYTPNGWFYLPLLQITADLAVMAGTIRGALSLLERRPQSKESEAVLR